MFTYLLLIRVVKSTSIKVGRKGCKEFKEGYYVYVGSGRKYGFQRIIRHLKKSKKLKWHIDYLLRKGRIEKIWIILGGKIKECYFSYLLKERGIVLMKKFGSTDCKCPSHLFYFKNNPWRLVENIISQSI